MDAHETRATQEIGEGKLFDPGWRLDEWVMPEDPHAERHRQARRFGTGGPEADHAERLAAHLQPDASSPSPAPHLAVGRRDSARQRETGAEHILGDRMRIEAASVHDRDRPLA